MSHLSVVPAFFHSISLFYWWPNSDYSNSTTAPSPPSTNHTMDLAESLLRYKENTFVLLEQEVDFAGLSFGRIHSMLDGIAGGRNVCAVSPFDGDCYYRYHCYSEYSQYYYYHFSSIMILLRL